MSKLAKGTTIRVTMVDDVDEIWGVSKALDVEWTGEVFLGCVMEQGQYRWVWRVEYLQGCLLDLERGNVHCMIEQLLAEGAI